MYNKLYGKKKEKQYLSYVPKIDNLSLEKRSFSSKYELKPKNGNKTFRKNDIQKFLKTNRSFTSNEKFQYGSKLREKRNYIYYISGVGYVNVNEESKLKAKNSSPISTSRYINTELKLKNKQISPILKSKILKTENKNDNNIIKRKVIIDNYKYLETKNVTKTKKLSNVYHRRLAQPFEYIEEIISNNNASRNNEINPVNFYTFESFNKNNLQNSFSVRNIYDSYDNTQTQLKSYQTRKKIVPRKRLNETAKSFTPIKNQQETNFTYIYPQPPKKNLNKKGLYYLIGNDASPEITQQELLQNSGENVILSPVEKNEEEAYSTIPVKEQKNKQELMNRQKYKSNDIYKYKKNIKLKGYYYTNDNDNDQLYQFENNNQGNKDNYKFYESKKVNKNDGSVTLVYKRGKKPPTFKTQVYTKQYDPEEKIMNRTNYYDYSDRTEQGNYPYQDQKTKIKRFEY